MAPDLWITWLCSVNSLNFFHSHACGSGVAYVVFPILKRKAGNNILFIILTVLLLFNLSRLCLFTCKSYLRILKNVGIIGHAIWHPLLYKQYDLSKNNLGISAWCGGDSGLSRCIFGCFRN